MILRWVHRHVRSVAFYPVTLTYAAGVCSLILVTEQYVTIETAIIAMAGLALILIILSTNRELRQVHREVEEHHRELCERIEQLMQALNDADVPIPDVRERGRHSKNARL